MSFNEQAKRIIATFERIVHVSELRPPGQPSEVEAIVGKTDLGHLLRKFAGTSTIIVVNEGNAQKRQLADKNLPEILGTNRSEKGLILVCHVGVERTLQHTSGTLHLYEPDFQELAKISALAKESIGPAFARFILDRKQRSLQSPYSTQVPASGRMFYDREEAIAEITGTESSFAIVGPRRVGKSSLANEVYNRLTHDRSRGITISGDPIPVFPIAFLDCLDLSPGNEIWEQLYDQIGATEKDRAAGRRHALTDVTKRKYRRLNPYESFRKLTTEVYLRPYIILDEVGRLLEYDKEEAWSFFSQLSGWAKAVGATLILVGYFELFRALKDDTFPFYQTCQQILLPPLPQDAAKALVREPLEELGFAIDSDAIEFLCNITGGFPAQIHTVSAYIARRDVKCQITTDVVSEAIGESKVLETPIANFRSEASPLAKFVVYWYCEQIRDAYVKAGATTTVGDDNQETIKLLANFAGDFATRRPLLYDDISEGIRQLAAPTEVSDSILDDTLDELVLRSILAESVRYYRYRFAIPGFLATVLLLNLKDGFASRIKTELNEWLSKAN